MSGTVAVKEKEVTEKRFVNSIIVRTEDGTKFRVPKTAEAAQAMKQIMASRVVDMFEKQAKKWENMTLTPKQAKEFTEAATAAGELLTSAFAGTEPPNPKGATTTLGQIAQEMVKAGGEAGAAGALSAIEQMRRLTDIGKKAEKVVKQIQPEKAEEWVE